MFSDTSKSTEENTKRNSIDFYGDHTTLDKLNHEKKTGNGSILINYIFLFN